MWSVCLSVSTLHNRAKTKQVKIINVTGGIVYLAEWIIDDTCLVFAIFLSHRLSQQFKIINVGWLLEIQISKRACFKCTI